jgi:hypothetical protein
LASVTVLFGATVMSVQPIETALSKTAASDASDLCVLENMCRFLCWLEFIAQNLTDMPAVNVRERG